MPEYEAFGTFEEAPRAIVMKSGAMAARAVIGLLASGAGPFVAKMAACLGPRFQTSVGTDGIA